VQRSEAQIEMMGNIGEVLSTKRGNGRATKANAARKVVARRRSRT
jgi:hypothetical protein